MHESELKETAEWLLDIYKGEVEDIKGFWWCNECKEEILPQNVTYQECCDFCGNRVEWKEE